MMVMLIGGPLDGHEVECSVDKPRSFVYVDRTWKLKPYSECEEVDEGPELVTAWYMPHRVVFPEQGDVWFMRWSKWTPERAIEYILETGLISIFHFKEMLRWKKRARKTSHFMRGERKFGV
jgi:hypothetical protein